MLKRLIQHHRGSLGCAIVSCLLLSGCGDRVRRPSVQELADFQAAEPAGPSIDMEQILQARITGGPYCAMAGDVLQVEIRKQVNLEPGNGAGSGSREVYACRVGDDGRIMLPVIGSFAATGKPLAEVERGIAAAYYPKYFKALSPIYVSVLEYNTRTVSIAGAVAQPGVYALRSDQMSLVSLLMKAGGIVQRGAAVIRIVHVGAGTPSRLPAPGCAGNTGEQGLWAAGPTGMSPEAPRADTARIQPGGVPCCLTFQREGPLRTTGWLAVRERGDIRVRQWLDVACEPQTSEFLREATAAMGQIPAPAMRERLVRLARVLAFFPPGATEVVTKGSGWNADAGGSLVTPIDTSAPDPPTAPPQAGAPARFAALEKEQAMATLALPVKGLNIPFADVVLEEGDSVVVEPSSEQFVSVQGLVRNAGNFPYPPEAHYNLAQAIGFAGGLDLVADPRYVSIYRLRPDGRITSVTVQLVNPKKRQVLTEALALSVRPGDIVSVEQTPRTRTNIFLDRVFRVSLGLYLNPDDIWNN